MLTTDRNLSREDIQSLSNRDAVVSFFAGLGYQTDARLTQTCAAMGITADSLQRRIKHIERVGIKEGGAEPLDIYLIELNSVTMLATQGITRALRNRAGNYLLVLTDDYNRIDFVLIERSLPVGPTVPMTARQVVVRPRILTIDRRSLTQVQLRVLRRFSCTEIDSDAQYEKLLSAYSVADWSEPLFNNRALFSDYYLNERLPERAEWRERCDSAYQSFKQLINDVRQYTATSHVKDTAKDIIQPVLTTLGFYISAAENCYRLSNGQSGQTVALCLAYNWNRNMDGYDEIRDPETPDENPGARVVSLLESSEAPWVIVTNGKIWRLYSAKAHSRATNYYEIDLDETLAMEDPNEAFRYFWVFFRAAAFIPSQVVRNGQSRTLSFLDELIEESEDYAKGLGERLKDRVFEEVFPHFAKGFIEYLRSQPPITDPYQSALLPAAQQLALKKEPDEGFRRQVFQGTLTFLYRLLFLLYAESRGLLPVKEERGYWEHSLTRMKEEIKEKAGNLVDDAPQKLGQAYGEHSTVLYDRLLELFNHIDRGSREMNVPLYNGGLFISHPEADDHSPEAESARFILANKIPDRYLVLGLDRLTRDEDPKRHDLVFIDYKSLGVRQLGSIYEGLLEFKIRVAPEKMAVVQGKKTEEVIPYQEAVETKRKILTIGRGRNAAERVYHSGDVYLENDKRERKATGSYYTPDHIVKYIVQNTVGPVLEEKFETMRSLFREAQQAYRSALKRAEAFRKQGMKPDDPAKVANNYRKLVDELFELRVLDPAMGSGHFLVEAVDFICDRILGQKEGFLQAFPWNPVTAFLQETRQAILADMERQGVTIDASRLTDINLLKRHILKRCIYGVDLNPMAVELAKVSLWLDCFTLGAPLSFLNHHLKCGNSLIGTTVQEVEAELVTKEKQTFSMFGGPFQGLLSATAFVEELRRLPDATIEQAERSHALYEQFEEAMAPYKVALDIWVSRYFGNKLAQEYLTLIGQNYAEEIRSGGKGLLPEYREVIIKAAEISGEKRFFHWDLEFPEAFVDLEIKTWKRRDKQGFDAVFGNPPYISFYSRHSQKGKTDEEPFFLRNFGDQLGGRVNSYLIFLAATVRKIRIRGYWAMVIPDTIVHNESYEAIRRYLVSNLNISQVLKFKYPLFEDATVGSSVLVIQQASPGPIRMMEVRKPSEIEQGNFSLDATTEPEIILGSPSARFPFLSNAVLKLINQMQRNSISLGSICEVRDGVNPGPKEFRAKILDPAGQPKPSWRKLLEGENIHRYHIVPPRRVIDYDPSLLTRDFQKKGASFREPWIFSPNKIVSRQTANCLIAALDQSDSVGINSVHFTRVKEGSQYSIWFVLACLNSFVLNEFYKLVFQETRSTFPQVHTSTLRQLPIPFIPNVTINKDLTTPLIEIASHGCKPSDESAVQTLLKSTAKLSDDTRRRLYHDVVSALAAFKSRDSDNDCFTHWIEFLLANLYEIDLSFQRSE